MEPSTNTIASQPRTGALLTSCWTTSWPSTASDLLISYVLGLRILQSRPQNNVGFTAHCQTDQSSLSCLVKSSIRQFDSACYSFSCPIQGSITPGCSLHTCTYVPLKSSIGELKQIQGNAGVNTISILTVLPIYCIRQ